jgi:hypothetical protein
MLNCDKKRLEDQHRQDMEDVAAESRLQAEADEEYRKKCAPTPAPPAARSVPKRKLLAPGQFSAMIEKFDAVESQGDIDGMNRVANETHALTESNEVLVAMRLRTLAMLVKQLAERVYRIEDQDQEFRYRGVWQPAETYKRNNSTTYDGSLWIATKDAPGKPGVDGWQLACKKGSDAR